MDGQDHAPMLSTAEVVAACGVRSSQSASEQRLIRWADAGLVRPVPSAPWGRGAGIPWHWPLDEARLTVILWLAAEVAHNTGVLAGLAKALRAIDPDEWHGLWRVTKAGAERVHQLDLLAEGWLVDLDVADRRLAPFVASLAVSA